MKNMNSSLRILTALVALLISASVAHANTRCVSGKGDDFILSGQKFSAYTYGDDNTDPEADTPWPTLKFLTRHDFSVKITGKMQFDNYRTDVKDFELKGKLYVLPNKEFTVTLVPASGYYDVFDSPINPTRFEKQFPLKGTFQESSAKVVFASHGSHLSWDSDRTVGLREAISEKYRDWGQEVEFVKTQNLKCFKI